MKKLSLVRKQDNIIEAVKVTPDVTLEDLNNWSGAGIEISCKIQITREKTYRDFMLKTPSNYNDNSGKNRFTDGHYLIKIAPGIVQICDKTLLDTLYVSAPTSTRIEDIQQLRDRVERLEKKAEFNTIDPKKDGGLDEKVQKLKKVVKSA
jgi:hypothetical protein